MAVTFSCCWILFNFYILFIITGAKQQIDCTDKALGQKTTSMRLKATLLCGYDKYVRPVLHHSNQTSVEVMLAPRIIEYHEDRSLIHLKSWISMMWTDPLLVWDKLQYDDMDSIGLDTNMIWVPDLHLYNSIEDLSLDQVYAPVTVSHNGQAYSFMSPTLPGHCVPNWTNWPYDTHSCTFILGSKRYLGSTVDFQFFNKDQNGLFMKYYLESKDWMIVSTNTTRNQTTLTPQNDTNPVFLVSLNYNFTIRRHASVQIAAIIIPGFVMIILSLGLLWIPSDKTERIAIICTLMIFQSLYIQYIAWRIPSNGDTTPYVACFYRDSFLLTGLLLLETLVTRSMLSWTSKPAYLRNTFQLVARNRVLQFVFINDMDPKSAAKLIEAGNDEGSVLMTSDENSQNWRTFVSIINKTFFIVLLPVYFLLSVSLLPWNFSISTN